MNSMPSDNKKKARSGVHWIAGAINPAHKGILHKALHVPVERKIPVSKLEKAAMGNSPTAKRARLAITLKSFH